MRRETSDVAYIALQIASILDAQNLRSVPGVAADTLQPVQVVLVEDLEITQNRSLVVIRGKQWILLYFSISAATHVTELFVDFARLHVHLHVGKANPLVQVLAVVDAADSGLGVTSGEDLQHVWWDVVLGLCLLVRLFVQTLQTREAESTFSNRTCA